MGKSLASDHLRDIAALPRLEVLVIFGYDVNDSNVSLLAASQSLTHLVLKHTDVSGEVLQRLWGKMPRCRIMVD